MLEIVHVKDLEVYPRRTGVGILPDSIDEFGVAGPPGGMLTVRAIL